MSCTVCGSSAPCRCSQQNSCNTNADCLSNSGCCGPILQPVPAPYYNCASPCPESHTQKIVLQQFYSTISIQSSWNVPACGDQATVSVVGLNSATPGSYIWNATYGYFEIISFDATSGSLVVENHCNDGNATAGTTVPACTEFVITVPPCDCGTTGQVCVAIDFTAPPAEPDPTACIDITLTSTTGLTVTDTVQIGSGFYFVQAIKPNDIITICNKGEGITPGTSVIAHPPGQPDVFNYCLSIIASNPCSRDAATVVSVIGCNSDGIITPLEVNSTGWVVTGINATTNQGAYRPLGSGPDECSTLSAILNLISGTASYAGVAVTSSTPFVTGDVLEIAGSGARFTVTGVPDGTHVNLTVSPVPGVNSSLASGSVICLESCCETLQNTIDALPFIGASNAYTDNGPFAAVTELAPTLDGPTHTFTIVNPSATKAMYVTLTMRAIIRGKAIADLDPPAAWSFDGNLRYTINGGPPVVEGYGYSGFGSVAGQSLDPQEMDFQVIVPQFQIIPAGATFTFVINGRVIFLNPGAGNTASYATSIMTIGYTALGIPVP